MFKLLKEYMKMSLYILYYFCYFMFLIAKYMFKIIFKLCESVVLVFNYILLKINNLKIKKQLDQYSKMYFDMEYIDELSGIEFEELVSYNILPNIGFTNIKRTQDSSDFGVDIVAELNNEKYAIQCKRYSDKVGVHAVQEVVGGKSYYDCDKCVVITNNYYSSAAKKLANKNNVWLIDRDNIESLEIRIYNDNNDK